MHDPARRFPALMLMLGILVLGTVYAAQYWGGLAPCELCLIERWPWMAAVAVSLTGLLAGNRAALPLLALVLGLIFLVGAGLGLYHSAVEYHWIAGPDSCTGAVGGAETVEQLRARIMGLEAVRCDQPAGIFLGLSLAGWNAAGSLAMMLICLGAWSRWRPRPVSRIAAHP